MGVNSRVKTGANPGGKLIPPKPTNKPYLP